jgi:hypothetical protein
MLRAYIIPAFAGALLLGTATAALAGKGEFNDMCSMALAMGKDVQTDCSINGEYLGKTYCLAAKRP